METPLTIENPPRLRTDERLYTHGIRRLYPHQVLERRVVWNLLKYLGNSGFYPFEVNDGDDVTLTEGAHLLAMEAAFGVDEAWVYFRERSGVAAHGVKLVMGNGVEVVSDYNYTPGDADHFAALMDSFDAEAFA